MRLRFVALMALLAIVFAASVGYACVPTDKVCAKKPYLSQCIR